MAHIQKLIRQCEQARRVDQELQRDHQRELLRLEAQVRIITSELTCKDSSVKKKEKVDRLIVNSRVQLAVLGDRLEQLEADLSKILASDTCLLEVCNDSRKKDSSPTIKSIAKPNNTTETRKRDSRSSESRPDLHRGQEAKRNPPRDRQGKGEDRANVKAKLKEWQELKTIQRRLQVCQRIIVQVDGNIQRHEKLRAHAKSVPTEVTRSNRVTGLDLFKALDLQSENSLSAFLREQVKSRIHIQMAALREKSMATKKAEETVNRVSGNRNKLLVERDPDRLARPTQSFKNRSKRDCTAPPRMELFIEHLEHRAIPEWRSVIAS